MKKGLIITLVIVLALVLVFALLIIFKPALFWFEKPGLVGNDSEEHGCIGSAGYSWCESKQKCLRVWEEECYTCPNSPVNCMPIVPPESDCGKLNADKNYSNWVKENCDVEFTY
jgi:hypothetical protein